MRTNGAGKLAHPLRVAAFRRLWLLTVVANLAALIQTVGAAWMMAEIGTTVQVALIQSAIALPVTLLALVAGTLADISERTRLLRLSFALMVAGAAVLAAATLAGVAGPLLVLLLCLVFGCGTALFGPSGMAAASDHVDRAAMPEAVASLGVAFNLARCVGPAVGGAVVALIGAGHTFLINALACLAACALLRGGSVPAGPRPAPFLPALGEAMRFAAEDAGMRRILLRAVLYTAGAGPIWALLPLYARDEIGGGAGSFGLLMSALGMGATLLAAGLRPLRRWRADSLLSGIAVVATGAALLLLALADTAPAAAAVLLLAGGGWAGALTLWNVGSQTRAPAALLGRAIGLFYTAIFLGLATGSWFWGHFAARHGLDASFLVAGLATAIPGLTDLLRPAAPGNRSSEDDPT